MSIDLRQIAAAFELLFWSAIFTIVGCLMVGCTTLDEQQFQSLEKSSEAIQKMAKELGVTIVAEISTQNPSVGMTQDFYLQMPVRFKAWVIAKPTGDLSAEQLNNPPPGPVE